MRNLKVCVCDDEPQILREIAETLKAQLPESEVREFTAADALLACLQGEECDLLLLDIDIPGMTGLEAAEQLTGYMESPLLVFVTSHDELVYDSLKFHPFGFVRKGFLHTELPAVLKDCERELGSRRQRYYFRTAEGTVSLPLEDILYFEAEGNYLQLYTADRSYRLRDTLGKAEQELAQQGFVRVHRGFMVNQAVVELLGAEELKLTNGSAIPIGRNYAEAARKKIMRYMLR